MGIRRDEGRKRREREKEAHNIDGFRPKIFEIKFSRDSVANKKMCGGMSAHKTFRANCRSSFPKDDSVVI